MIGIGKGGFPNQFKPFLRSADCQFKLTSAIPCGSGPSVKVENKAIFPASDWLAKSCPPFRH